MAGQTTAVPINEPSVCSPSVRLRITHIITKARPMGGSQIDTLWAIRLQRERHQVELIAGSAGPLVEACQRENIPAFVVPMRNALFSPLGDLRAFIQLCRLLRHSQPHIVHTHASKAGVLGRLAAALTGVPVVVHTLHSPPFHDRQRPVARLGLRLLEKGLCRITDRFIAVAVQQREQFISAGICPPEKIVTIHSGIDFDAFPADAAMARCAIRKELGIAPTDVAIVAVGELTRDKGYDLLLTVAERIGRRDVRYLIVGPGSFHDDLSREIGSRRLQDIVQLLGARNDVAAILAAADVFVQTSWREGLSRSLIEAMYVGLPVIATDAGATREVIADGETGLLIARGDVSMLAQRLAELFDDPCLRTELGRRARDRVRAGWSLAGYAAAHERLYRQVFADSRKYL